MRAGGGVEIEMLVRGARAVLGNAMYEGRGSMFHETVHEYLLKRA
jgi:hypothetical protein